MLAALVWTAFTASAPAHPAPYPVELRGAWRLGVASCHLPDAADSEALINVRRDGITAYASSIGAYSIRLMASKRQGRRLDEFGNYEGETRRFTRTIVLPGDTFISIEDARA